MFYTRSTLDRADHLRKDPVRIQTLRERGDTRLLPVWQGQSLVSKPTEDRSLQALLLAHDCVVPEGQCVFLGLQGETPLFAVDVSALDDESLVPLLGQATSWNLQALPGEFTDLRTAGPNLSYEEGSLLAYARGMIYWNSNTRHCLHCGQRMVSRNAGHARQCMDESCDYMVFPRTDPAVIMLVSHTPPGGGEPVCLLGRSPAWPVGVFSTLAGFVEPGETLEHAVRREVFEEAGILTSDVQYIASQPWPFPRSIMLGFEAVATSTAITCDPVELADAQWFTREQLLRFGNWGDAGDNYKLPRKDSIARHLIDRWMNDVATASA